MNGPIPLADLKRAYSEGKLGEHCELIDADMLTLAEAKRADGWRQIDEFVRATGFPDVQPPKAPESVEDLLRRLIAVQERQVFWMRMTAVAVFASFLLFFVFGVTFRFK